MAMQAAMVGWAHTRFGRLDDETMLSVTRLLAVFLGLA